MLAPWKFLLSFLKTEWTVSDYPLHFERQDVTGPDEPAWSVRIVHWPLMLGSGGSREEALRHLQRNLEEYRARQGRLPRPGTKVPIQFASTDRIDRHPETLMALLTQVLGFDETAPIFVSDDSSLRDFPEGDPPDRYHARIREVFGVDVSDVPDDNIATILERIDGR